MTAVSSRRATEKESNEDERENGTYAYSPSISTRTKTTIPTLNMSWWDGKTINRLQMIVFIKQNINLHAALQAYG